MCERRDPPHSVIAAQAAIQPSLRAFDVSLAHICCNVSGMPEIADGVVQTNIIAVVKPKNG